MSMSSPSSSLSSSSTSDDSLSIISRITGPKLSSDKEYLKWSILMRNHLVRFQLTDILELELKSDSFKNLVDSVNNYNNGINESFYNKLGITKIQPSSIPKVKQEDSASSPSSGSNNKDQIKINNEAEFKIYSTLLRNL